MKRVAILQSNYIPWKGYFDIIAGVDLFIFHDDLQYTKNDWRNRNKIKTDKGSEWITIPCGDNEKRLICNVELKDSAWQKKHWRKIVNYYKKAKFFNEYKKFFEEIYLHEWKNLSSLNQEIIKKITHDILGFTCEFQDSRSYNLNHNKSKRVEELLIKSDADIYLSGPSAKNYLDEKSIENNSINIEYIDYSNYPEYSQLYPPFIHEVSIIDLIFNEGSKACNFMINSKKS